MLPALQLGDFLCKLINRLEQGTDGMLAGAPEKTGLTGCWYMRQRDRLHRLLIHIAGRQLHRWLIPMAGQTGLTCCWRQLQRLLVPVAE
jgi:hypothetical protein